MKEEIKSLHKKLMKIFNVWFSFKLKGQQKQIIDDIEYLPSDAIIFLNRSNFKSIEDYIENINVYLSLEQEAYNYPYKLEYKVGNMKNIKYKIDVYRTFYELKTNILNGTN